MRNRIRFGIVCLLLLGGFGLYQAHQKPVDVKNASATASQATTLKAAPANTNSVDPSLSSSGNSDQGSSDTSSSAVDNGITDNSSSDSSSYDSSSSDSSSIDTGLSDTNLSNDNAYTNSTGTTVHSPAASTDGSTPDGATAQCVDGTYSFSQSRSGTCSYHGGVALWL